MKKQTNFQPSEKITQLAEAINQRLKSITKLQKAIEKEETILLAEIKKIGLIKLTAK